MGKTLYLKRMGTYQRHVARLAYRSSGGNEERASHLFISASGSRDAIALLQRSGRDEDIKPDFARMLHTAYLDAFYAFLDGLVHVAFSEPLPLGGEADVTSPTSPLPSRTEGTRTQVEKADKLNIEDRVGVFPFVCQSANA